ncbi:FecCD family ABC transporter permease [Psychromicrobium sp. YIM B11713]|uniref:FecCD family ABC transporter permease n=1 Tax=Psychromicrobium sp. YIM B11713 TaxID=3145233 RepID=UPI00374FAE96
MGLVLIAIAAVCIGLFAGAASISWPQILEVFQQHLSGQPGSSDALGYVIWESRVPRVILALLVGSALSLAGLVLQSAVRNPMADPYILGVTSGASAVNVLVIGFFPAALAAAVGPAAAFVGALLATSITLLLSKSKGKMVPLRLILAGVSVGYLGTAITSYVQYSASSDKLNTMIFWLLGSLAGARWDTLLLPALAIGLIFGWLLLRHRRMDLLLLSDESASSLGLRVNAVRTEMLVIASLLCGIVVALAGGVGFVGLMIPHLARLLVGPTHRRLIPTTLLLGAGYLEIVDVLSRTIQRPQELPLGILTAALGVPFLLWLLRRESQHQGGI